MTAGCRHVPEKSVNNKKLPSSVADCMCLMVDVEGCRAGWLYVAAVFEMTVEDGEKCLRPTDFMKYVHDNDDRVLDRELSSDYYKYH